MIPWLDAQLSPAIPVWLRMRFDLDAFAVRDLELREAENNGFSSGGSIMSSANTVTTIRSSLPARQGNPPKSPYLRADNRLGDVIAAIQAMGTYKFYKLEFSK